MVGYYQDPTWHKKSATWLWLCDCGKEIIRHSRHVTGNNPRSISCGCQNEFKKNFGAKAVAYQVYSSGYKDGDITFDQFLELSQQECYWCGEFNQNTRKHNSNPNIFYCYHGLDRIDTNKTHNLDNIVTSCWRCNNLRSNRTVPEFLTLIQDIYHNRLSQYDQSMKEQEEEA